MKVLITGASSNIGFEVAKELSKRGHFVYLSVHHDYEIKTSLEKIKNFNLKNITCFKLDITKEEDRQKIKDLDVDCLVNNAAIGVGGSLLELPIDLLEKNFEVNVFSALRLTQIYASSLFLKKKNGKIVFMSSIAGIIPLSFLGSYCATKASLITIAKVLRKELKLIRKDNSIKVKLIEPGIYNTGFNDLMIENKLNFKSKYFENIEDITLKQKELFSLIGKDNLESITRKIVEAILDDSNKLVYRAPFSQAIGAKLYLMLCG